MPTGSLKLEVTDLLDDGVEGNVRILLRRAEGGPGSQEGATFPLAGETVLTLEDMGLSGFPNAILEPFGVFRG